MNTTKRPEAAAVDFYASYGRFKEYGSPSLKPKSIRRFDRGFWNPAECTQGMSVLEVGCGTGQFLFYLHEKGIEDFLGIDQDPELAQHMPEAVTKNFLAADVWNFLQDGAGGRTFDRIAMFDVLEHFTPDEGANLLRLLSNVLKPNGRVIIRVPNMGSPWGAQYQFGDLTHKAAFTPHSMRQLAFASEYECVACYPHLEGSRFRQFRDQMFHGFISRFVMVAPEIWSANFFALLEPGPEA